LPARPKKPKIKTVDDPCAGDIAVPETVSGLWDCHTHLQDPVFQDRLEAVIARARAAGLACIVVNGTSPEDWPAVAALAARFPDLVRPAYGVHPLYVDRARGDWQGDLRRRLEADPAASVGEIGLDRSDSAGPLDPQREVLEWQVRLAIELSRPFTVHCRRAWDVMLPLLQALGPFPRHFVMHSYGGGEGLVAPLLALGSCFSFSGTLTWPRNRRGPAALAAVPADRVLCETDAPDLPPWQPEDSDPATPNEPANLPQVVRRIAELRGGSVSDWATRLTENARRCFGSP